MDYLNRENIGRSNAEVEYHPLKPFLPGNAKVLFLGSFPPQRKRWCMDFYYPNFINDHWRLEGEIFFGDRNHFVDTTRKTFLLNDITDFCHNKGLAFFDTATAVRRLRDNASDKFLEVVEATDIRSLLQHLPLCQAIVTTGEKATATLCQYFACATVPKVGTFIPLPDIYNKERRQIILYRLPSSSRAYPLSFDKKASAYKKMFSLLGIQTM